MDNDKQPDIESRAVAAGRGWAWIVEGVRLFLRNPVTWLLMLLILFAGMKLVSLVPVLGLVAVLLMPIFLAGLMDGCKALDEGRPLEISHLISGFRRNPAQLVTLGGIYLVGNVVILMIVVALGGEAIVTMARTLAKSTQITPQIAEQLQAATLTITRAALVGTVVSLPLLMALWFAPLLSYFHGVKPLPALRSSLIACVKNTLPMCVYGLVLLVALMVLVPIGLQFGHYDLGVWLMMPALVPSIYVSYKEIYATGTARAGAGDPLPR